MEDHDPYNIWSYSRHTDIPYIYRELLSPCSCGSKEPELLKTEIVYTPYYYSIIKGYEGEDGGWYYEDSTRNYSDYDLFAFKTRMRPVIRQMNSSWEPSIFQLRTDTDMVHILEVKDGDVVVSISPEMKVILDKAVTISAEHEGYALVFTCENDIYYKNTRFSKEWLRTIITYINLPHDVSATDWFFDDTNLMVKFMEENYLDEFNRLHLFIIDELYNLYMHGAMVLDSEDNEQFIQDWELKMYNPTLDSGNNLYLTEWNDLWLSSDIMNDLNTAFSEGVIKHSIHIENVEQSDRILARLIHLKITFQISGSDIVILARTLGELRASIGAF